MIKLDLQKEFIKCLGEVIPNNQTLICRVAEILQIEKESAYRRLSGRVNFSIREMGLICLELSISLDSLVSHDLDYILLPLFLKSPLQFNSIQSLINEMNYPLSRVKEITSEKAEFGYIANILSFEFFMFYPTLTKFMFFKWGYYFVGTPEFLNFSKWEMPNDLKIPREKVQPMIRGSKYLYIWDYTIIWSLVMEIENFYKMGSITTEEKNTLALELKKLLTDLEYHLMHKNQVGKPFNEEDQFYISTVSIGYTICYGTSLKGHTILLSTNFSSAYIDDREETLIQVKNWMKYLRNVSTLISGSGHIERRCFFRRQLQVIDTILR